VREIRAITIDLDDTLWPIQPVIERAERRLYAWLSEHYPRVTEQFAPQDIVDVRDEVMHEHAARIHDLTFLRRAVISRMGVAAGYGTRMVDDAFAIFLEERNDVELFPDVLPALESLSGNYTLVAVTNGNANLDKIGIRRLFSAVISPAVAGAAKPARRIFDVAVRAAAADAAQTVHVGDHPEHDVQGARMAGLNTVWVNRHGFGWPDDLPRPDEVVTDIGELVALLGSSRA
jgi:FMN hydrolase / 5-amino-6-(5-phospho-D-ribitylamino)uracil phosphatase